MRCLHQGMQGRPRLTKRLNEIMNWRAVVRTRIGLALAVVLVLAAFFRLALPPMVVADAAMESICTASGKTSNQKIDPQASGRMHSHSDPCDYCLPGLDNLAGLPIAEVKCAFSQAVSIKPYPEGLLDELRLSWATPYSRAPPSIAG